MLGAMIAYVQQETAAIWHTRVAGWIGGLVESHAFGWSAKDQLHLVQGAGATGLTVLRSSHTREMGLPEIELRHLWLQMN
jgi:hypothetical protein